MGGPREDGDRDSLHFPRMGRARAKYVHVGPPAEKTFWILHAVTGHFGLSLCRFGPKSLQPESFWSHGRFGQNCCVVSAIRRLHVHMDRNTLSRNIGYTMTCLVSKFFTSWKKGYSLFK